MSSHYVHARRELGGLGPSMLVPTVGGVGKA
jgi:hypothetical protein